MDASQITKLIEQGGVIAGVVAALIFATQLLKVFAPIITDRLGGAEKRAQAAEGESEKQIAAFLERARCVPQDIDLREMDRKIAQLYAWHNKTDADGAPVWYVRSSLIRAIEQVAESQVKTAQILAFISQDAEASKQALARLEKKLGTGPLTE